MIINNKLQSFVNFLIFAFFITVVTIKNSYYITSLVLLVISIVYIAIYYKNIYLNKSIKNYILAILFYYSISFLVAILNKESLIHSYKSDHFLLLSIPLLIFFKNQLINIKFFSFISGISCIICTSFVIYNKFFLHITRGYEEINVIPTAAVIMTLALFNLTFSFYFYYRKSFRLSFFTLLASIIGLLGTLLTGSRGSWLIFPVGLIILSIIYWKSSKKLILSFAFMLISLLITSLLIPQTDIQKRYQLAISNITQYFSNTNKQTSVGIRLDLYKSAIYAIQEKPLLGWGKEGMQEKRKQQVKEGIIPSYIAQYSHSHNQFLEQAFYRGLIGLFVLLFLFYTFFRYFFISYKNMTLDSQKVIAILGILNILACISFNLTDALLRGKEYAMFFYISNLLLYAMLEHKKIEV